jgi:hypothetical protein
VSVEEFDGEHFIAISDSPEKVEQKTISAPKQLGIAWDASGSRTAKSVAMDRKFF